MIGRKVMIIPFQNPFKHITQRTHKNSTHALGPSFLILLQ